MTNEQLLEQQVEALEKLLKLKQAIVEELERKIDRLEGSIPFGFPNPAHPINVPNPFFPSVFHDACPADPHGIHQYPSLWGGTGPVPCTKCGKQMTSYATSGYSSTNNPTIGNK